MQRFCLSGSHILTIAPPLLRLKGYKIGVGVGAAGGGGGGGGGGLVGGTAWVGARACMPHGQENMLEEIETAVLSHRANL